MYNSIFITLLISIGLLLTACEPREDRPPVDPPAAPPQPQQHTGMDDDTPPPTIELTEEELDEFIDANQEASDLLIDPETNRQAMEDILDDKEMDINRFNEIQTAVQQEPALQQQIQQRIQQRQAEGTQMQR